MKRVAVAARLALVLAGAASGAPSRNLTPPRLYGEYVAGRPVTVDPGNWTGAPTFQFFWERCTTDGSLDRDVGRRLGERLADDEARPMTFALSARR
jgi:hypothetical protein